MQIKASVLSLSYKVSKKKKKENLTYKSGHMEDVKTIQDIEE